MSIRTRPVTVEHHREPLGIGEAEPRLSWITDADEPGWAQHAYELEITDPDGGEPVFTTGRVVSIEQVLVEWPAEPLADRARRVVRVRVWGRGSDRPGAWSEPTTLETGLRDPGLWEATFVAPVLPAPGVGGEPAAYLRGTATIPGDIARARIRATAHGVMTLRVNGEEVGQDVLHPGWTSYGKRLRYRTWDVTGLVREGRNAVGVQLADGWFRGYLGFAGLREVYGDTTAALVQLEVDHADGSRTVFGTDASWRSTLGPITRADLYMGETYDARRALDGWDQPGYDDSAWDPVAERPLDPAVLVAPDGPAVRRTEVIRPQTLSHSSSSRQLVDFGQNLVGRLQVHVPATEPGTRITFRHAEVLENGELGLRPLRRARATDEVVSGGEAFTWEPEFTFHGFRYAEVEGWPGELGPDDLQAVVIHTDMRPIGTFETGHPLLNRLHENVVWGMRGNFLDVPTDCPQRDERLGWTGDLQTFAPTAAFIYDTAGMLTGWLADLAADQRPNGDVPVYVPWADVDPHLPPLEAEAGWGDAATVVPWTLYERYGDPGVLRGQWASMRAWVDALAARAGERVDFPGGGFSFGDWLDSAAPDDQPWAARLPWQAVATAYLARSARIVASAAEVLGDAAAADQYRSLGERCAERFRNEYVTPNGRMAFPSQTAYALAIAFELLDAPQRAHAGELLAGQVAADGFRIGSGFLGTPWVCDALADSGHEATAYRLLLQTECPSWLYAVTMGATTVWERWNSMLPDGSINPGGMTSFNHYSFGSVADFLHRRVAGMAPALPGYRRSRIAPLPSPELRWARASHETPYGRLGVSWTLDEDLFRIEVIVPPSTTAEILLPDGSRPEVVASGTHRFACRFMSGEASALPGSFSATSMA